MLTHEHILNESPSLALVSRVDLVFRGLISSFAVRDDDAMSSVALACLLFSVLLLSKRLILDQTRAFALVVHREYSASCFDTLFGRNGIAQLN